MESKKSAFNHIALIGNYLPRQCGIATFTTDLCEALSSSYTDLNCLAIPVNDVDGGYDYPSPVRFELTEQDIRSYRQAADFINISDVDLVCLQHEYGIYGGPAGSYILGLLRKLKMPLVTTLHTVLHNPNSDQLNVLKEIGELSDRLVVMSKRGLDTLRDVYQIPQEKIDFIPHGIPDVSFVDPNYYKDCYGVEGKTVLLTFGLLSPNKGIEYVINALPDILDQYPDVAYIILGTTHPHVKRQNGETYRESLQSLVKKHGIEKSVLFHNQFVTLSELIQYIGASDLYVTPYLNPEQTVSGTLAYTVGAGKAVVSTPYWYAEELLSGGRGLLVPFANSTAMTSSILHLLKNETERHAMRKRAYEFGRQMTWPNVAHRYMESFEMARESRSKYPRAIFSSQINERRKGELPFLKLDHLKRMTDETGMLQHAIHSIPNYHEGYSTDDNARALVLAILLEAMGENSREVTELTNRYLGFLLYAFNASTGRFRNFLSYERHWLEDIGSEDSHGRSIWALGTLLGRTENQGAQGLSNQLFHLALPAVTDLLSPRTWAFCILGINDYLKQFSGDRIAQQAREILGERLMHSFYTYQKKDWPWFEDSLTYCNATLPHALILCGFEMNRSDFKEAGLETLEWLCHQQRAPEGHFVPIGNNGFYLRGGEKARFDQQPVEAQATIHACLDAYRYTHDQLWWVEAHRAFEWFLGYNDLHTTLYDYMTGGCRDGLHPDRTNENQGAESTLSFLMSLLEISLAHRDFNMGDNSHKDSFQSKLRLEKEWT